MIGNFNAVIVMMQREALGVGVKERAVVLVFLGLVHVDQRSAAQGSEQGQDGERGRESWHGTILGHPASSVNGFRPGKARG